MTRVNDVSESYSLPVSALAARGVFTVDDLWACIGHNKDTGVKQVVDRTIPPGLPEADQAAARLQNQTALLAFLVADALGEADLSYKPKPLAYWLGFKPLWNLLKKLANALKRYWRNRAAIWSKVEDYGLGLDLIWLVPKWLWRRVQATWKSRTRLWPDLVFFMVPLVVIGLAVRARLLNSRVVQRVAVKQGATLPKFTAIDTKQLTTRPVFNQSETFASVDDLKKRYVAGDLTSGTLVKEQQLLPAEFSRDLAGRQLLTLQVKNNVSKPAQPNERVKLMLTSREKEIPSILVEDVILLTATKTGESMSVVVAVTDAAVRSMTPLLGVSDVFVLQTL